jgi:thymidylate synthase
VKDIDSVWLKALGDVLYQGREVQPRGKRTLELPQYTLKVDMRRCVLTLPERKLSYSFMAREAWWILSGDDRTESIVPWNKNLAQFSDDGVKFFGAYGPKVLSQLDYVTTKLLEDNDTRQAGLTIWRENPPQTKDVPCTVAIFFATRGAPGKPKLEVNVFMRSNDLWLGTPYDVFNFSMIGHCVCARLNRAWARSASLTRVYPGELHVTAASMHLYEENWDAARNLSAFVLDELRNPVQTPEVLSHDTRVLMATLKDLSNTKRGHHLRWWESQP